MKRERETEMTMDSKWKVFERMKKKKLGAKMEHIKMLTRNIRTSHKLYLMRLMMLPMILEVAMANKWIEKYR